MSHQTLSSLVLVLLPLAMAALLVFRALRPRAALVLVGAAVVTTTVAIMEASWPSDATLAFDGLVRVDATARLFLGLVNPIFLGISAYIWHRAHTTPAVREQVPRYVVLALLFLAAGNAVLIANHLIVLWILLEATTFAAAPLIVRPRSQASQRASWRYLVFSSVGLGMVLLGFVCLERGMHTGQTGHVGAEPTFFVDQLLALGAQAGNDWTRVGLGLVLFGLGTKLGLAPMYTWLPEAYEEAPPAVTALLGSIQFNCALVVLFRVVQVYRPGNPALVENELLALGIATMTVSTVSIIATRNLWRLMAYASINHAGVIAIGLGVGKNAAYGLLLYVLSNAFIKTILFLTAGKITAFYGTRDTRAIAGLVKDLPFSGFFLMVGTFALLGFPPFGSFIGELLILSALVTSGQFMIMAAFCMLITATFVAMGRTVFPMIWGEPKEPRSWPKQPVAAAVPKMVFLVALVILGIYIPPTLNLLIKQVAASLGGT